MLKFHCKKDLDRMQIRSDEKNLSQEQLENQLIVRRIWAVKKTPFFEVMYGLIGI
jgi:hypothetical protein